MQAMFYIRCYALVVFHKISIFAYSFKTTCAITTYIEHSGRQYIHIIMKIKNVFPRKSKYDEYYLNDCIKKATPNLSKIKDVDKTLDEIRGQEPIKMDEQIKIFILWLCDLKCPFNTSFNGEDKSRPRVSFERYNKKFTLEEVYEYWFDNKNKY